MVRMLSRPALQNQEPRMSETRSAIYSTWTNSSFYLAFRLEGFDAKRTGGGRNFVDYDARRAWGEDVCEALVQPVYEDNSLGPVLHIVCKPYGQIDVTRRLDPRSHLNPWQAFSSTDIRYEGKVLGGIWYGELALPWEIMNDPAKRDAKRPVMLRFNFSQHRGKTGESASWAGPVDFGRDDAMTGVLVVREP